MKAAVLKFLASLPESIPFVEAVSLGYRCMTSLHGMLDQARRRQGNESRYTAVGDRPGSGAHYCPGRQRHRHGHQRHEA